MSTRCVDVQAKASHLPHRVARHAAADLAGDAGLEVGRLHGCAHVASLPKRSEPQLRGAGASIIIKHVHVSAAQLAAAAHAYK
jgi:hypothetical protein